MSKALRTVAMVAGAVALVATGVGAAAGAGLLGAAATGTAGVVAGVSVGTIATVASVASVAAGVAGIAANLTMKKPPARGSVTDVIIMVDPPQPYMMGRTYSAGVLRHDAGYGPEIDKIKNPYLGKVVVYSGAGPIQEIESRQFDYQPLSFSGGWYYGFVGAPAQLGACPEPAALAPPFAGLPNWGTAYKLSGQAAVLWNMRFDKKAERFASGVPPYGIIAKGVRVYDPRLDSTYPGGSGPHRITNEATWTYSESPALHAIAYIYGRYQNEKKVFGIGMPASGIDMARFVAWANVCDANGWKVGGTIFEPGDRWTNLKDIMAAGGAEPIFSGGLVSVSFHAPQPVLDTVYEHDLASDDISVTAMQSYRDRRNGIVPKYRSEAHNWQYVSTETVRVPEYVIADGEERINENQYNLVQQANQAAQLAAYDLLDSREMGPIVITLKPQWRRYKPGERLRLILPSLEIDHIVTIKRREFDPAALTVRLTCQTETPGKDAFALGQTATPPPAPVLATPQERDQALADPYTARLPDIAGAAGGLLPEVVDTPQIVPNAVNLPIFIDFAGVTLPSDHTAQHVLAETGFFTLGTLANPVSISVYAYSAVEAVVADSAGRLSLYIDYDGGAGWQQIDTARAGARTDGGSTLYYIPTTLVGMASGVVSCRLRLTCQIVPAPGRVDYHSVTFINGTLSLQGIKR